MFFEEGWIPVSTASGEVFKRLQALNADGQIKDMKQGLKLHLSITIWDICDASSRCGVTGADGAVIEASKELVNWADPRSMTNEHLDLLVGSVGSTTLKDENGNMPTQAELEFRYGPFLSLPVCVPVNNFQSSLTFLEHEVKNPLRDEEIVNAAKAIITMLDAGKVVTREIAREKLAATLSRRKLKLAWALAADHRPQLAAPNRWEGL